MQQFFQGLDYNNKYVQKNGDDIYGAIRAKEMISILQDFLSKNNLEDAVLSAIVERDWYGSLTEVRYEINNDRIVEAEDWLIKLEPQTP